MQATEALCQAIGQTTFDSLPAQVVEVARQIILDGIAVAVAGSTEAGPRIVAEHVRSLGGKESSTVLGYGFKTSPLFAAYVNGISMHVLDYEPVLQYQFQLQLENQDRPLQVSNLFRAGPGNDQRNDNGL